MAKYKKYNGTDKYHFRFYRINGQHPFLVVLVETKNENGKHYFSGYIITHDITKKIQYPNKYVQLHNNPNPKDEAPSYLCKIRLEGIPEKMISKPFNNWHLSKEDEKMVDKLEEKKKSS
jgi:hypothetical protein